MSWRSDMDEFGPDLDFWEEVALEVIEAEKE